MEGVVLAAGAGSRLGYLGGILPKTMVPLRGQPLLFYALRTLSELGASEARVALRPGSELVEAYLRRLSPTSAGLRTVRPVLLRAPTRSPVETLFRSRPPHERGPWAVVLGDDLTVARGLEGWVARFDRAGASVAQGVVHETDREAIRRTCEIDADARGRVREIREKPESPRHFRRGCGLYLFRGEDFPRLLRAAGGLERAHSLSDLVAAGAREGRALSLPIRGRNINVNTVGDVIEAWSLLPRDREAAL